MNNQLTGLQNMISNDPAAKLRIEIKLATLEAHWEITIGRFLNNKEYWGARKKKPWLRPL